MDDNEGGIAIGTLTLALILVWLLCALAVTCGGGCVRANLPSANDGEWCDWADGGTVACHMEIGADADAGLDGGQ